MFGRSEQLLLDCQFIPVSADQPLHWQALAGKTDKCVVLWDLAAHMPPMILEKLIMGLQSNECRVGVRFAGASIVRSCALWRQVWGRLAAVIRQALGMLSDAQPPCFAVGPSLIEERRVLLSKAPAVQWSRIVLNAVRQKKYEITEVPVMWSER